jgi:hypothetical protein
VPPHLGLEALVIARGQPAPSAILPQSHLAQRYLAYVRRLPDDVVLKPEPIKTDKEAIESRTNRSYLRTRAAGLQCRSSLHGHDHSRHRWGIGLYLGRR